MPFSIEASDFVTIGLLVLLEAVLSADNALVLAVLVLPLPRAEQTRALRYGILGAFFFRIIATVFAVHLMGWAWIKLVGGLYLLYLPVKHFTSHPNESHGTAAIIRPLLGLSLFWSTVVRVELTDVVFAIDSILVAVAMSPKLWVIITGGLLGIVAMRLVIGQLLVLVQRYPALVDGAFVIIGWVALKLFLEYAGQVGWVDFHIPKELSLGLIVVIFAVSYVIARRRGPKALDEEATRVIKGAD
jgi:YkoY family integral membrane protein